MPDAAFANLTTSHGMCAKLKHLRARSFYLLGRNLRLIAELKHQTRKTNLNEPRNSDLTIASFITKWGAKIAEIHKRIQTDTEQNKSKAKSTTNKSLYDDMTSQVTIGGGGSNNPLDAASFASRRQQQAPEQALEAIYSQREFFVEEENTANVAKQESVRVNKTRS